MFNHRTIPRALSNDTAVHLWDFTLGKHMLRVRYGLAWETAGRRHPRFFTVAYDCPRFRLDMNTHGYLKDRDVRSKYSHNSE